MARVSQAALASARRKGKADTARAKQKPGRMQTARQLAEAMGCHVATIYRGVADGSINAIRLRGVIRIPEREFKRLTGQA